MKKFNFYSTTVLIAALLSSSANAQQTKRNLVANGNFENETTHWRFQYFEGAESLLTSDTESPISGTSSAQIEVIADGTNAWSSMFYYIFPVENQAKYKVTWKAKASQAMDLHLELCQKHDTYTPLTATTYPATFISDDAENAGLMRGSVSLTTDIQEYTFITDGTQLPDGGTMLAFHFGHAPVGAKVWFDDVKISRCDNGDWDGNLTPYGDFEQVIPIEKCGDDETYKVGCCITDAGKVAGDYIDADANGINGQSFHAYLGSSTGFWDFAPWFAWYANENCTFSLSFTAKADKEGARISVRTATSPWGRGSKPGDHLITEPTLSTTAAQYSLNMSNGLWGDGAGATSSFFDAGADATYFGLQKCFISLSEPGFAQTEVNFWIDDFKIFEDNLILEDFELLNVPTTIAVGEAVQMKVGEFVKPTHAPCTVYFDITSGQNFAEIDDEGNITALAPGAVTFTASDVDGVVEKEFTFTVVAANALKEASAKNGISIYPNVVKSGAIINMTEAADVEVYNTKGELVIRKNYKNIISTQNLTPGIYFAIIKKDKATTTSRFVVE